MAISAPLRRATVGAAFGSQAFGYAALTTALPMLKDHTGLTDTGLSLVILGIVVGSVLGTLVADAIAIRAGSRAALVTGLLAEAAALACVAALPPLGMLLPVLLLQGLGLGLVDAAANMQGSLAEREAGAPVFGRLFATATAAGIASTLVTLWVLGSALAPTTTLVVAAAVHVAVALVGLRIFDPSRAAREAGRSQEAAATKRGGLPRAGILMVGLVVFAAFVVDSAIATWGTVYTVDVLRLPSTLTPLGYGIYLAAVLAARLVADPAVRRLGRSSLALTATVAGLLGTVLLVVAHPAPLAMVGFALAGLASGWLVPLAFSKAGELLPARSDEVIARVNLFNYAAAVLGAVVPGLVADAGGLNLSFLLPALALVACVPVLRALRGTPPADGQGNAATGSPTQGAEATGERGDVSS